MTNLRSEENKYFSRHRNPDDLEICLSDGSYLMDEKGRKYIDFTSGWCVGNLGWGNEEIKKSIKEFSGPDYVSPHFYYEPWVELAKVLAEITPGDLVKSFRATGGTEAVEFALRAAMVHTGRKKIVSIEDSYHGNSMAALKIGPSSFQSSYSGHLFENEQIPAPLDISAIERVEECLKKSDVAALIMEPIVLNLAVHIPTMDFMNDVQNLCQKYGTLLIMDEVASGFGRTGKLFACEHYGIKPDIMCLGKSITGGYAGMGAMIATEEVAKPFEDESHYYSTYGWHPLSVQAALANIDYIQRNKAKLMENVEDLSTFLRQSLLGLNYGAPLKEIRSKGMAFAVELESFGHFPEITASVKEKGLLIGSFGKKTLIMFPPINLEKKIAQEAIHILEDCTQEYKAAG